MESNNSGVSEGYSVNDRFVMTMRRTGGIRDIFYVDNKNNVIVGAGLCVTELLVNEPLVTVYGSNVNVNDEEVL